MSLNYGVKELLHLQILRICIIYSLRMLEYVVKTLNSTTVVYGCCNFLLRDNYFHYFAGVQRLH